MTGAVSLYENHATPSWHEEALCAKESSEIFFGREKDAGAKPNLPNMTVDEVRKARMICNRCPVQMECLEWAITRREEFGIWGGSTSRQRRKWLRAYDLEHQQPNRIDVQEDPTEVQEDEETGDEDGQVLELSLDVEVFDSMQADSHDYSYRVAAVR